MKRSKAVVLTAALALLIAAPAALAQAAGGPQAGPPGIPFLRCLSILGLSDQQKADIKAVVDAEKPVLQQLGQTLKADAEALKAAVQAGTDACAIGNAVLKVKADEAAVKAELEKIRTSVEALLTADQKAKLEGCLQAPHHGASQAILGGEVVGLE